IASTCVTRAAKRSAPCATTPRSTAQPSKMRPAPHASPVPPIAPTASSASRSSTPFPCRCARSSWPSSPRWIADVLLYYAAGGGLGHVTRTRAFLHGAGLDGEILTSANVPEHVRHDLAAYRDWLRRLRAGRIIPATAPYR